MHICGVGVCYFFPTHPSLSSRLTASPWLRLRIKTGPCARRKAGRVYGSTGKRGGSIGHGCGLLLPQKKQAPLFFVGIGPFLFSYEPGKKEKYIFLCWGSRIFQVCRWMSVLGPPARCPVAVSFFWEGSPTTIDYGKKLVPLF